MALARHFRTKGKGMERKDELSACKEQLVGSASNPTLVQRYAFSLCFLQFIYLLTEGEGRISYDTKIDWNKGEKVWGVHKQA